MDLFYAIKEPISQLVSAIVRNGTRVIPSEEKGVFITLFFIIFATTIGVGIVVPLLPIYAHDKGAAGIYVAMIFAAFSISKTLFLPWFGRLSDGRGRKPFILGGLLIYAGVALSFIVFSSVKSLIIARVVQGAGSAMILPVVQAYVGEITPEGAEGYSMGLFNLSMFLSLSLGPLLGGSLLDRWSMDVAFGCMGAMALAGFIVGLGFLPSRDVRAADRAQAPAQPWSALLQDRLLLGLLVFRYAYTACIGTIWCFLPLFASQTFDVSGTHIGFLVMVGIFISGVLQLPMGYVADRFNKRLLVLVGGCISALGMVMLCRAQAYGDLLWGVVIFGGGGGVAMPAVSALAVISGEIKKSMGAVMSAMTLSHSLGMLTGSLLAGVAMDAVKLTQAFAWGGISMGVGTLIFFILYAQPDRIQSGRNQERRF